MNRPKVFALLSLGLLLLPMSASACSVCMGDPNSKAAGAINAAIFLMLGFILSMLGLLVAFGVHLYRRSQSEIPEHLQLAEMIGTPTK
jgi:hypothetical protein